MFKRSARLGLVCAAVLAPTLATAAPALSPHDLQLLNRITWGADAASAAQMSALGRERWLDRQLHPTATDGPPPDIQARIDAFDVSRTPMAELVVRMQDQRKAADQLADPAARQAGVRAYTDAMNDILRQGAERSLLRDLYASDQLAEQMSWFWLNHFNVQARKRDIRAMMGDYEERAIRPHALGRFRDLLEATLRHPAMLRYLDNDQNAAGKINENYAREIMELHTLGVGSRYSQKDVQELARILTGVGVDERPKTPRLGPGRQAPLVRDGLFEFNPNRHDFGDKVFLGHAIKGSGFGEVEQALDILAREPATARHVSTRLAVYFVGDDPPPALVDRMTASFRRSNGDIAQVLKTLFASPEFDASLGKAFKDPMHYVVSAVRIAFPDRRVVDTRQMQSWLRHAGEGLYARETPDGYPLESAAWSAPGDLQTRFEVARKIGAGAPALFRLGPAPPTPDNPGPPPVPPKPVLQQVSWGPGLGAPTREALDKAASPQEWGALYLSSPEFMRR